MEKNNMTAVEWLAEKIDKLIPPGNQILISIILAQAKQMEKQQIEKAWWAGHDERNQQSFIYPSEDCNGYYNETYGK